jgi:hypothetical protein
VALLAIAALLAAWLQALAAEEPGDKLPAAQPSPPPRIPLSRDTRLVIRPTILGLVPNQDPEGYGDLFARILGESNGQVQLYFEVKELMDKQPSGFSSSGPTRIERDAEKLAGALGDVGQELLDNQPEEPLPGSEAPGSDSGPQTPAAGADTGTLDSEAALDDSPVDRPVTLNDYGRLAQRTRIRRSELTFGGLIGSLQLTPPLFWDAGFNGDAGGGLWVSKLLLNQLKSDGGSSAALTMVLGGTTLSDIKLSVTDANARYPVLVNGARADLPALRCRDSLGLAEYWILDDPANPMLLKLSFIPPDELLPVGLPQTADELLAAEASKPASSSSRRSQFGGYEDDADEQAGDEDAGEPSDSAAAAPPSPTLGSNAPAQLASLPPDVQQLVICGSGYAVVSIDF